MRGQGLPISYFGASLTISAPAKASNMSHTPSLIVILLENPTAMLKIMLEYVAQFSADKAT